MLRVRLAPMTGITGYARKVGGMNGGIVTEIIFINAHRQADHTPPFFFHRVAIHRVIKLRWVEHTLRMAKCAVHS